MRLGHRWWWVVIPGAVAVLLAAVLVVLHVREDDGFANPRAIANKLGCIGFDDSSSVPGAEFVSDGPASCTYAGATVVLIVGRDGQSRDRIASYGLSHSGIYTLRDANWAMQSRSRHALQVAQEKIGGTLK